MSYLKHIIIYPIKSLDGIAVTQATVLKSGALEHDCAARRICDREFVIIDQKGRFVNGKRNTKVHLLRTQFDFNANTVCLQVQGSEQKQVFHLDAQRTQLENWLSEYFGFEVELQQNSLTGFPDDTEASGPTIISTATLETVASWFPGIGIDEMRRRQRANIEIEGVPPFWEDRLFGEQQDDVIQFQVGDVRFEGINPCQRCVVPTRDSLTGKGYPEFQKIFVEKRKETLPAWAAESRFNHFYRLSVNTRIAAEVGGKILQVGDEVKIRDVAEI